MPILWVAFFMALTTQDARAFHIRLYGLVTEHFTGDVMKGVQVRLVKDSIERETVTTSHNGKYELILERGYDYLVWFHRNDLVTKFVRIDAREIPLFPDVPFYEMDLQMTMFTWIDAFDFGIFDSPVGMAAYKHSVRNLNWDFEYTQRMKPQLTKVMIRYERELEARRKAARLVGDRKRKRKEVHF